MNQQPPSGPTRGRHGEQRRGTGEQTGGRQFSGGAGGRGQPPSGGQQGGPPPGGQGGTDQYGAGGQGAGGTTQQGQAGGAGQQSAVGQQPNAGGQQGTIDVATAIARAVEVCAYCADQCIRDADPGMVECIRLCEDVTELGEAALVLVPRDSRYAGQVLGTFQQAATDCAMECSRHPAGHCQECATVLEQTVNTVQQSGGARQS